MSGMFSTGVGLASHRIVSHRNDTDRLPYRRQSPPRCDIARHCNQVRSWKFKIVREATTLLHIRPPGKCHAGYCPRTVGYGAILWVADAWLARYARCVLPEVNSRWIYEEALKHHAPSILDMEGAPAASGSRPARALSSRDVGPDYRDPPETGTPEQWSQPADPLIVRIIVRILLGGIRSGLWLG